MVMKGDCKYRRVNNRDTAMRKCKLIGKILGIALIPVMVQMVFSFSGYDVWLIKPEAAGDEQWSQLMGNS